MCRAETVPRLNSLSAREVLLDQVSERLSDQTNLKGLLKFVLFAKEMHLSRDFDMDNPLRILTIEHAWFSLVLYEVGWHVI